MAWRLAYALQLLRCSRCVDATAPCNARPRAAPSLRTHPPRPNKKHEHLQTQRARLNACLT
eukprot:1975131-Rhodomonas_salina.2